MKWNRLVFQFKKWHHCFRDFFSCLPPTKHVFTFQLTYKSNIFFAFEVSIFQGRISSGPCCWAWISPPGRDCLLVAWLWGVSFLREILGDVSWAEWNLVSHLEVLPLRISAPVQPNPAPVSYLYQLTLWLTVCGFKKQWPNPSSYVILCFDHETILLANIVATVPKQNWPN